MMSTSLVNVLFVLCSEVKPSGSNSFASRSNQIFVPCSRNISETCLIASSVIIGVLSSPLKTVICTTQVLCLELHQYSLSRTIIFHLVSCQLRYLTSSLFSHNISY